MPVNQWPQCFKQARHALYVVKHDHAMRQRTQCKLGIAQLSRSDEHSRSKYTPFSPAVMARASVVLPTWRGPSDASAGNLHIKF